MTAQIPIWMKRYLQQDMSEEKEDMDNPVKLLDVNGRSFIWWLCKQYAVMSDGVMGQSCSLLERYISKKMKLLTNVPRHSNEWRHIKRKMAARVPLMASVCVALTTKMMSSERQLHAKTIRNTLAQMGTTLTLAQINAAELDVLSSVGFNIPMFTNVEKAVMMAVDVNMTGTQLEGVALVMELAEYYRSVIQDEVIAIAVSMRGDKRIQRRDVANIWNVHLVAGAVLAAGLFFGFSGPDPLPRLSFLAQCTQIYIKCIGDLIHNRLQMECGPVCPQPSRKRKMLE